MEDFIKIDIPPLGYVCIYITVSIIVFFAILRRPFRNVRKQVRTVSAKPNLTNTIITEKDSISKEQLIKLDNLLKLVNVANGMLDNATTEEICNVIKLVQEKYYDSIVNQYLDLRAGGIPQPMREQLASFFYDYALALKTVSTDKQELYKARDAMRFGLFIIDQTSPNCTKYMNLINDISEAIRSSKLSLVIG